MTPNSNHMATDKDRVRVNLTLSPEVHSYLLRRSKITGSTVAGTATDMIVAGMMHEADRLLKIESLAADSDPND